MTIKTSFQGNMEKTARAVGINLPISTKVSYEVANRIRGMDVKKAIAFLEEVVKLNLPVPYKRYNDDVGHKRGKLAAGRFPVKASQSFIKVLKNAVSNAGDLGLNEDSLKLVHISTSKGTAQWHYGRQRRRQMKATNIDVVVQEVGSRPVNKPLKKGKTSSNSSLKEEKVEKTTSKPLSEEKVVVSKQVEGNNKVESSTVKPKLSVKENDSKPKEVNKLNKDSNVKKEDSVENSSDNEDKE